MAASTKDQCGPKEKNKQNFVPIVKCQTLGNNPAQKKQTKKSAKAKPAKSYLKAPFTYEWPKISESVGLEVVSLLKEMFSTHGLERQKCARGGKLLKEKKSSTDNEQVIEKWKCFVFGINAVTRCVEKGQSSLVLCDNSVQPNVLTTHLIEMCRHSGIPAASLPGLSSLAETLGFTSLTSLAFRELSYIKSEEFHKVVNTITNKIPKLIGPMVRRSVLLHWTMISHQL
ncbi:RPP38 [Bugula neritina]|uniref:RPP38 n=1 Tax=Bugula neritina TaxID=10212 RepID=A0A7J7JE77_BUGNE|nr:RPP38 [Bugula neritina]